LLWGDHDTVVARSVAARLQTVLGERATALVLLRGGHVSMWDDPDGFGAAVTGFLASMHAGPQS
jgi:pimeloyl-ACP methyl ester carboxylesterase